MLGLFGTLNLAQRSLQAQRQGIEVAGHNLANANNAAYARQRLILNSTSMVSDRFGTAGTGIDSERVQQVRSALLDDQIVAEASVSGSLEAQQKALDAAQAALGQQIDTGASGTDAASAAGQVGTQFGISASLSALFTSFQSLANQPTSQAERQGLLNNAVKLAADLNQADKRITSLKAGLDASVGTDVKSANELLKGIADLNQEILSVEGSNGGTANDLRDSRQQKLEQLAKLVDFDTSVDSKGMIGVSIGGVALVSGKAVSDTLETYADLAGNQMVRAHTAGTALTLTGGSIHGTIDARNGALNDLKSGLNTLASTLISEVNAIHGSGFGLSGTTGAAFFSGSGAGNIAVNSTLVSDPSAIQASGVSGASGDNQKALALAQLANKSHAALGNLTFQQSHSLLVANLGDALKSTNTKVEDQGVTDSMLQALRQSAMGVSLDEEMTSLTEYQKAYQASAKLINTIDEMLDTVINLKR